MGSGSMIPGIGVFVGFCGTVGGLAMMIHGWSVGNYFEEQGVVEGGLLVVMSLVVFAASRRGM
jgi:hypothetical protein